MAAGLAAQAGAMQLFKKKIKKLLTLIARSARFAPHTVNQHNTTMKKTLLIAAAALAASVITSQAQVYSQNIVGYYNTPLPAGKFALVANQLVNGSDANKTNNSINTAFSGLRSDDQGVANTTLYRWNGTGYNVFQYFTGVDADTYFLNSGSVNGFYDPVGNLSTAALNQGSGSFLYNPSGSAITNTTFGTVVQGTNSITITTGFNIYSIIQPISTNISSSVAFANFPGTSDVDGNNNDTLYLWNGNGYNVYQYFTGADADNYFLLSGSVNGFYDPVGNYINAAPLVGQAFFLRHIGAPVTWTVTFVAP